MSILWCGGEDVDFLDINSITWSTSAGNYRSDFARVGGYTQTSGSAILRSPLITPISSLWFRFFIRVVSYTTVADYLTVYMRKNGSNAYIGVGVNASPAGNGHLCLLKWDGSYTLLGYESSTSMLAGNLRIIDVQIINYGPSGTVKVYIDGALKINYTGDIAGSGQTTLDQFGVYGSTYASRPSGYYSEMIVADEDTRAMSLKTLVPNAAGDTNEWTGAYTDVDEVISDDGDNIYTLEGSKSLQLNLTGMPTGNFNVKAVKVIGRLADGTGKLDAKIGVKTNSVVHLGDQQGLSGGWQPIQEIFNINPQTTSDWTGGEIDALQIALQSVSTTTTTTTTTV